MIGRFMGLLYEQIAKKIEQQIIDGEYPLSSRLPGENKLAKAFGVARPTLHKAICILEKKGIIECRPSVGNFVIKTPKKKRRYAYIAPNLSDPFQAEFIREFNSCIVQDGGSLSIDDNSQTTTEKIIERLQEDHVDGVVFCSTGRDDSLLIKKSNIPAIWFATIPSCKDIDYIVTNSEQGMREALNYLSNNGIYRVGYAEGNNVFLGIRKDCFLKLSKQFNMRWRDEWLLATHTEGETGGKRLFELFCSLEEKPDALIFYNDWNAIGFINAALDAGVCIPEKLRVIGFDNLLLSRFIKVPLTTIDYSIQTLAKEAFRMLLTRIEQPDHSRQVYIGDGELIVRKS
jgi:LacI family transcriptional regulator